MRAIILAAGRGSRMRHLTDERPKCLVELFGRPLLDYQLNSCREAGVNDIAIVTGYKREMLSDRGLSEFNNPRWAETQMVRSLLAAEDWLTDQTCLVTYSDIFFEAQALQSLIADASPISITYDPNWLSLWTERFGDPLLDAETFRLDAAGSLAQIGGRAGSIDEIEGQYMGLLCFRPSGWAAVREVLSSTPSEVLDSLHMTALLQRVISETQTNISAIPYRGVWGEIDSESDLSLFESYNQRIASSIRFL